MSGLVLYRKNCLMAIPRVAARCSAADIVLREPAHPAPRVVDATVVMKRNRCTPHGQRWFWRRRWWHRKSLPVSSLPVSSWTIDNDSTIFLDLKLFKGALWLRTDCLDTETYYKPINACLYIPWKSAVPRSVLRSLYPNRAAAPSPA